MIIIALLYAESKRMYYIQGKIYIGGRGRELHGETTQRDVVRLGSGAYGGFLFRIGKMAGAAYGV